MVVCSVVVIGGVVVCTGYHRIKECYGPRIAIVIAYVIGARARQSALATDRVWENFSFFGPYYILRIFTAYTRRLYLIDYMRQ